MPLLGERGHHRGGDVLDVHERLGRVADGERELALEDALQEHALAEVLHEERGAHDRRVRRGVADEALGELRVLLAAARQQDDALHAGVDGHRGKVGDRVGRAGHGEVGRVGDREPGRAVERGAPGRAVVPVERDRARAGGGADGDAAGLEAAGDARPGLAGGAGDEDGGEGRDGRHGVQCSAARSATGL